MKRGRKSKLEFHEYRESHNDIDTKATRANNLGMYTVESLTSGIYYFFDDEKCVIAGTSGFVMMSRETAKQIADEFADIVREVNENHRTPMSSKAIGKMLERDFA